MTQSPDEFEAFVTARYEALLRFAVVVTGERDRAQDVLQNALVRTAVRWNSVRDKDHPDAYVRRAIVTQWANTRRGLWRDRVRLDAIPEPALPDGLGGLDDHHLVWSALASLPPRQRAVVVLRFYEQLSESEIADVLGCGRGTVKSQAAKGLEHLRRALAAADARESCR